MNWKSVSMVVCAVAACALLPAATYTGTTRLAGGTLAFKQAYTGGALEVAAAAVQGTGTDGALLTAPSLAFTGANTVRVTEAETLDMQTFGQIQTVARLNTALSAAPLSVSGIAERLGKTRNGHLSATVRELVMAGFVREEHGFNPMTGRPAQKTTYRICDNYVRFYFRAIRPRAQMIAACSYRFESLDQLPGWESILGLQFENLVLNALPELVRRLGLDRSLILSAAPFRKGGANGCQIDCLIQTKRSLYVIEIKRRAEIGGEVIGEVEEKIARLKCDRRLSVRPILVYDGRLSPSVREENYFAMIISAEELFL